THGDEVENQDTWQRRLEEGRPDLEVLNLGVPGYGTDQALLRWRRDGSRFQSQFVILGIWPENMCRNLGCFRYYLVPTESFASKPRMLLEDGALRVINSPVAEGDELTATLAEPESHPLLAHDFWYRAEETQPKAFQAVRVFRVAESMLSALGRKRERMRLYTGANPAGIDITVAIARQFSADVRAAGATPLVLIIPMRDLLGMHTAVPPFPLVRRLREQGLDVIDLGPRIAAAVKERGAAALYARSGHHSIEGNRVLAAALLAELQPWFSRAER
ncbi:MAG TPA: hypothetical protein VM509_05580, partial [Planctomycetota bacterium]|nr:hypothetical protein [Planctomycetota bacterium]